MAAMLQAVAFLPAVTVCVCGWCTAAGDGVTTTLARPTQ